MTIEEYGPEAARERVQHQQDEIEDLFQDLFNLGRDVKLMADALEEEMTCVEEIEEADLDEIELVLDELDSRVGREIQEMNRRYSGRLDELRRAREDLRQHEEDL